MKIVIRGGDRDRTPGVPDTEPRHGFNEDDATRRLLRSPPPEPALRWAESAAGAAVAGWSVLRGGMSSAMYSLDMADERRLVLRCYVRPELNEEEPDLAPREAAALRAVATVDLPTPELVAVERGETIGVPAVLMTWVPGRVVWDPKGPMRWLSTLAGVLPVIHEADTAEAGLGLYFNYEQQSYGPPKWAAKPKVCERAVEVFHGPVLDSGRSFIHRDFHPGNVLWRRGRVTGVVDWQSACIGPPSVDIGHCRANLLGYAPELASTFTRMAETATGRPLHPWADIAALIGMLDGLRSKPPHPAGRQAIERAIEDAVSACG